VELISEAVVDEGGLLLVRLGPAAILEDHIVVPTTLDPHVGLGSVGILLLEQRIAGENVLHADTLLLLSPLSFLTMRKVWFIDLIISSNSEGDIHSRKFRGTVSRELRSRVLLYIN